MTLSSSSRRALYLAWLFLAAACRTIGVSQQGESIPAHCKDQIKDEDETGVDCGGLACAPCAGGSACEVDGDCASVSCLDGVCASQDCSAEAEAACGPGEQCADERCACGTPSAPGSAACNPLRSNACAAGECQCHGGPACEVGQHCTDSGCTCDATSCPDGTCSAGACVVASACVPATCTPAMCGTEPDGCGGTISCPCTAPTQSCTPAACQQSLGPAAICNGGVCACTPSCAGHCGGSDGCSGTCPNVCGTAESCDPTSNTCVCAPGRVAIDQYYSAYSHCYGPPNDTEFGCLGYDPLDSGTAFYVYPTAAPASETQGLELLNRCKGCPYQSCSGVGTTSCPQGMTLDVPLGYVAATAVCGSIPLFAFYSSSNSAGYFYTTNPSQLAGCSTSSTSGICGGWDALGIVGYVWPN